MLFYLKTHRALVTQRIHSMQALQAGLLRSCRVAHRKAKLTARHKSMKFLSVFEIRYESSKSRCLALLPKRHRFDSDEKGSTFRPAECSERHISFSRPCAKQAITSIERGPEEAVLTAADAEKWWAAPDAALSKAPSFKAKQSVDVNINAQEAYIRGPAYEKHSLALLKRLRFSVNGSGRANDGGIDFEGWWLLPDREVRVLGQCKNESKNIQPKHIRDFIGSMETRKEGSTKSLGVFVSRTPVSANAMAAAQASEFPILVFVLDEAKLSQVTMNNACREFVPGLIVGREVDQANPGKFHVHLTYAYDDEAVN